jgi:DNA-binding IscR family transcriptional regulator
VRQLEGPIAMFPCASKTAYQPCADCPDEAACHLRHVMIAARDQMASVLDEATLASALQSAGPAAGVRVLTDEVSEAG